MKIGMIKNKKAIMIVVIGMVLLLLISTDYIVDDFGDLLFSNRDSYHMKRVKLEKNNIYKDGFQGILNDISSQVNIPKKLYIDDEDSIDIRFEVDGKIKYIDTELYGKDDNGDTKIYNIYYNKDRYNKIKVKYKDEDRRKYKRKYGENRNIEVFLKTMKVINLKNSINQLGEYESSSIYGVLYQGKRFLERGTEEVRFINRDGEVIDENVCEDIVKSTVSVYVPGENITPIRYILVNKDSEKEKISNRIENSRKISMNNGEEHVFENGDIVFKIDENIRFYLEKISKGCYSNLYNLYKVDDNNYNIVNNDIFISDFKDVYKMKFFNEKVGFLFTCENKNNGGIATLYRTDDGGESFFEVTFSNDVDSEEDYNEDDDTCDYPLDVYMEYEKVYLKLGKSIDDNGEEKIIELTQ
ncbi:hypothetical protein [uncultured Clostridium sp.]|uniref:hypothetical protein n=1 Tax=uncultured Clostridium sp. TaxID=59620 RepID=UPI0025DDD1DC|nr:hypothetical protein [uncultured Clostridium sp.]